jgi:Zn finger protein HypA/HybF involved in hydrogenase expression
MCLVDSSTTIDIESGELGAAEYYCNECKNKFKAFGKRIRCPACMSANVKKV